MTALAVIQGYYTHLKFIGGRKVVQMWVEFDVVHSERLIAMFGTPNPETDTPVIVARYVDPDKAGPSKSRAASAPAAKEHWGEMRLAKQAGIRCGEPEFQKWLFKRWNTWPGQYSRTDTAAQLIRLQLQIDSRAEFDTNEEAGKRWKALNLEYEMATGKAARDG